MCEAAHGKWRNPSFGHFDDVLSASLLLFEMSSLEGWNRVLWICIDAVAIDEAPQRDHSPLQVP